MKYRQLTKEQFLELHKEFAEFLATQQIDAKEWETIKNEKPKMAEDELNIFSDIVWESVLNKATFIEHISEKHINLFKCNSKEIIRIYIQLNNSSRSFLEKNDFDWFLKNPLHESLEYFKAVKKYKKERNMEVFELIELGGEITSGNLFTQTFQLIQ
ncbi:DUF6495 family protein [Lutibacter holmesii]|uniref:DUF6495 family protein n=1 Tax=Lutibacter holmesii TaxID=1137985 RepID=A0ABW3WQB4_9FLAO